MALSGPLDGFPSMAADIKKTLASSFTWLINSPKPSLSIFVLRGLFNSEFSPNDSIDGHDYNMHTSDPVDRLLRTLVSQR